MVKTFDYNNPTMPQKTKAILSNSGRIQLPYTTISQPTIVTTTVNIAGHNYLATVKQRSLAGALLLENSERFGSVGKQRPAEPSLIKFMDLEEAAHTEPEFTKQFDSYLKHQMGAEKFNNALFHTATYLRMKANPEPITVTPDAAQADAEAEFTFKEHLLKCGLISLVDKIETPEEKVRRIDAERDENLICALQEDAPNSKMEAH